MNYITHDLYRSTSKPVVAGETQDAIRTLIRWSGSYQRCLREVVALTNY